ncbi:glycosyltransferase family 2 protein [Chitinophaga lutea]
MKLSVIFITYNRPGDLLTALKSVVAQQEAASLLSEVIVVNNASSADYTPVREFMDAHPDVPFVYYFSDENLGVARGRNKAISLATGDVLVTLDDDAWFRDNDALVRIRDMFGSPYFKEQHTGILCFKVFYASTGELQQNAFPHKQFERYRKLSRFLAPYYIGCGHAILREVYDRCGLYPADFFYGMEEYDLTYRTIDAGYSIVYDASVVILHDESPQGRAPHLQKMKMLWINKSKVAFRYLPRRYFYTTALMWSVEFLRKTGWNWKEWRAAWKEIRRIPRSERRWPLQPGAMAYLRKVKARLWY